jgi:glycosyltransferase involved in cell wall biosynthesis
MAAGQWGDSVGLGGGANVDVVYLAGSGRSGSTLLERTLGAIPGWVNVGELIELFRKASVSGERCGCGEPFDQCPFWSQVGDRAFGGWSASVVERIGTLQREVSRQRYLPQLLALREGSPLSARVQEYADLYARLYRAVAEVSGAHVVVDASKWPGQALALRRGGVDVRLLHVVRDARGVAYSWAKKDVARPHGGAGSVMANHPTTETARRWAAFQTEILTMRRAFENETRLRYEDFVADPEGALSQALRGLGFQPQPADLAHVRAAELDLPASHGVAGNPSRFRSGTVPVRADDAWRRHLSGNDRRTVTALTAPLLLRFGYPLRPGAEADERAVPTLTAADVVTPTPEDGWPPVTVVLPTRGRPELLREAVDSVLGQDYDGDIDLVVVHDQEEPQRELTDLARPGRSVTLLTNTHAPGLAGARNTGLEIAKSDYVASCDDDDFWDRQKLRIQMHRMLAEPDLAVLGAGIRLLMSADHVVEWPGDSATVTTQQLLRSRRKELHSSTLLVRRPVYEAVGGYDEVLPTSYAEDYEFLLRAARVGRIGVVNLPLASVRKYNASWFRDRAEVVASALEYLLEQHPQIATSRRGHARVLGQIAFARSTMGQRRRAVRIALHAISRWPVAPHALLALVHASTGIDPAKLLGSVRRAGRGIT